MKTKPATTTTRGLAADLRELLRRAASVRISPAEIIVIDADSHVDDEALAGGRLRTILVLEQRAPAAPKKGKRR